MKSNFNGILVNRYNDGEDSIGAHSDNERTIDRKAGVVSLSLGQTRTFRIKEKLKPGSFIKKAIAKVTEWTPAVTKSRINDAIDRFDVPLKDMNIVVMKNDFQKEFTHEIPKESKVTGVRYNLTFRYHTS